MFGEHSDLSSRRVRGRMGKGRPNPPPWHRRSGAATAPPSCLAQGAPLARGPQGPAGWGGREPWNLGQLPREAVPASAQRGVPGCRSPPATSCTPQPKALPGWGTPDTSHTLSGLSQGEMQLPRMGQGGGLGSSRAEMPGSSHQLLPTGTKLGHSRATPALLVTACSAAWHATFRKALGRHQDQDTWVIPTPEPVAAGALASSVGPEEQTQPPPLHAAGVRGALQGPFPLHRAPWGELELLAWGRARSQSLAQLRHCRTPAPGTPHPPGGSPAGPSPGAPARQDPSAAGGRRDGAGAGRQRGRARRGVAPGAQQGAAPGPRYLPGAGQPAAAPAPIRAGRGAQRRPGPKLPPGNRALPGGLWPPSPAPRLPPRRAPSPPGTHDALADPLVEELLPHGQRVLLRGGHALASMAGPGPAGPGASGAGSGAGSGGAGPGRVTPPPASGARYNVSAPPRPERAPPDPAPPPHWPWVLNEAPLIGQRQRGAS